MAKPKNPKNTTDNLNATPEAASPTLEATDTKSKTKRPVKKPSIVRAEPRATLIPINVEDEIRQLAYLLSERRGFEPGHETEDWLNAEREVRQRYHQHSA